MVDIAPPPLLYDETDEPDFGDLPETETDELLPPPFDECEPLLAEPPLRDPPPDLPPPPPPPLAPPPLRGKIRWRGVVIPGTYIVCGVGFLAAIV